MAYNLDFSGWNDARQAMANAIINQGKLDASKYNTYSKMISGLTGAIAKAYDNYKKGNTGLIPDNMDPMQFLSASNNLTGDEEKDAEKAELIKQFMRYYNG